MERYKASGSVCRRACAAGSAALLISLSRQGILCIPALLLLEAAIGADGLLRAQPVADLLSTALAVLLYLRTAKGIKARGAARAA